MYACIVVESSRGLQLGCRYFFILLFGVHTLATDSFLTAPCTNRVIFIVVVVFG